MGRATIVSNSGEGLYIIKPEYDMTALEAELAKLNAAETEYAALILKAMNTLALLRDDAAIARNAMNAILQQWIDGIIAKGNEQPEPIEPDDPNDPETGLPWIDPDRAQEEPLLDSINDARTAASVGTVSRDDDLDAACLAHLRYQAGTGGIGHTGQWRSKPSDRANQQGYYQPDTIHELLAYGETTPARVMSRWQREPATWADLLDDDVTHAGVAHVYARNHPGSYLWAVLLASAKSDPITNTVTEDPADAAAEDTEAGLDSIKAPSLDDAKPEKLGEAVRLFALAQNKVIAADREVTRLMAERLARLERIDILNDANTELENMAINCWCASYTVNLDPGATVETAEVPGWYDSGSINILPNGIIGGGKLRLSDHMTASSVFINAALEPGHLKWRPYWRYGIITAKSNDLCSITLNENKSRKLPNTDEPVALDITPDDNLNLVNVPIYYPPCNGRAFLIGDEVLIDYQGQDRTNPRVIGFRSNPRPCPPGRLSWDEL